MDWWEWTPPSSGVYLDDFNPSDDSLCSRIAVVLLMTLIERCKLPKRLFMNKGLLAHQRENLVLRAADLVEQDHRSTWISSLMKWAPRYLKPSSKSIIALTHCAPLPACRVEFEVKSFLRIPDVFKWQLRSPVGVLRRFRRLMCRC